MTPYLSEIAQQIDLTNNGKLLITALPKHLQDAVPLLIKRGFLYRATFMTTGDAVRLA